MMPILEVENDPLRPFIIHQPKRNWPVLQVSVERKEIEIASALTHCRAICIHQLYQFAPNAHPEAICERDSLHFVASKVAVHAH